MIRPSSQYRKLLKMCRRRGCSRDEAQDVVQEAYMRMLGYQREHRVRDPVNLLRRIAVNLSINHYHRTHASPLVPESVERLERRGLLIHPAPSPERVLAGQQLLLATLDRLATRSQRACWVFVAQRLGYSYDELAAACCIKHRTVEKHVATMVGEVRQMGPPADRPPVFRERET